jgi:hypothetical protein
MSDLIEFFGLLAGNFDYWIDFFISWLLANIAVLFGL